MWGEERARGDCPLLLNSTKGRTPDRDHLPLRVFAQRTPNDPHFHAIYYLYYLVNSFRSRRESCRERLGCLGPAFLFAFFRRSKGGLAGLPGNVVGEPRGAVEEVHATARRGPEETVQVCRETLSVTSPEMGFLERGRVSVIFCQ